MIKPLKQNDKIRIVSPSGTINALYIETAKQIISQWGFRVDEGKFARGKTGRFSGTEEERISDLQQAIDDPEVRAIFCSRGGYGLAQIIDRIDLSEMLKNHKWIIGFSDITVLHSALSKYGIASIHGIMAKHLSELPENAESVVCLKEILNGEIPVIKTEPQPLNLTGTATGKLVGGNLSVIYGLRSTPYDLDFAGKILFIEDVGEKPYHIDRMMQNLRMSGALKNLSALIVGQFYDCAEDPLMNRNIAEIILNAVKDYDFPVCFNFPAGHSNVNLPLIMSACANLTVSKNGVMLNFLFDNLD